MSCYKLHLSDLPYCACISESLHPPAVFGWQGYLSTASYISSPPVIYATTRSLHDHMNFPDARRHVLYNPDSFDTACPLLHAGTPQCSGTPCSQRRAKHMQGTTFPWVFLLMLHL